VRILVHVVDSSGGSIANVGLALVSSRNEMLQAGLTDSSGRHGFTISDPGTGLAIVGRKIGYSQARVAVSVDIRDGIAMTLSLARSAQRIDGIVVEESRLPLEKRPFIDSAEISASTKGMTTLFDVLRKLRPDTFYQAYRCIARRRLYINGRSVPTQLLGPIRAEHIAEAATSIVMIRSSVRRTCLALADCMSS
jgi:hypothetical protein